MNSSRRSHTQPVAGDGYTNANWNPYATATTTDSYADHFSNAVGEDGPRNGTPSAYAVPYDEMTPSLADWTSYVPLPLGSNVVDGGSHSSAAGHLPDATLVAYAQWTSPMAGMEMGGGAGDQQYAAATSTRSREQQAQDPLDASDAIWQQQHQAIGTMSLMTAAYAMLPLAQEGLLHDQDGAYDINDDPATELAPSQSKKTAGDGQGKQGEKRQSKAKAPIPDARLVKAKQKEAEEREQERRKAKEKSKTRDKDKGKNNKEKEEHSDKRKRNNTNNKRGSGEATATASSSLSSRHQSGRSSHSGAEKVGGVAEEETIVAAWPGQLPTQPHSASSKQRKRSAAAQGGSAGLKLITPPASMDSDAQTPNTAWSTTSSSFNFGSYPSSAANYYAASTRSGTTASLPDFECQLPSPSIPSPAASQQSSAHAPMPTPAVAAADPASQRARNRLAATKCRAKTEATISQLEEEERHGSSQHEMLAAYAEVLREEVWQLKNELLRHSGCNCVLIQQYVANTARLIGEEAAARSTAAMDALQPADDATPGSVGGSKRASCRKGHGHSHHHQHHQREHKQDFHADGGDVLYEDEISIPTPRASRTVTAADLPSIARIGAQREQERLAQLRRLSDMARSMNPGLEVGADARIDEYVEEEMDGDFD